MSEKSYSVRSITPLFDLQNFDLEVLEFESDILKYRLVAGDNRSKNLILRPHHWNRKVVVYHFSGLAGNGTHQLNLKFNSENSIEEIIRLTSTQKAPEAAHVFVDSINSIGGTQFINSPVTGNYEDHFINEVVSNVEDLLEMVNGIRVLYGGSSGGFGVLHLVSKYPDMFPIGIAVAPDSAFDLSLRPDCIEILPDLNQVGLDVLVRQIQEQNFKNKRNSFKITNAVAMACCYCPIPVTSLKEVPFAFDVMTGEPNQTWLEWQKFDPCQFLRERLENVKKVKGLWLSVGKYDEFYLQYGARRIERLLSETNIEYNYSEFSGGHRDLSTQREPSLKWLLNFLKAKELKT